MSTKDSMDSTATNRNARVGTDCSIDDRAHVAADACIGNGCRIGFGAYVGQGVTLEDQVELDAGVVVAYAGAQQRLKAAFPATLIRRGAKVGANATLLAGVTVGAGAVVEPGAVVARNIPPNAIVSGNPAAIVGYAAEMRPAERRGPDAPSLDSVCTIPGVRLYAMPIIKDIRGTLSAGEFDRSLPFIPKRYFIVYDVSDSEVRGEHAHKALHQFLVCVKGSVSVVIDNGQRREELLLDTPGLGLHIPPMIWATQYKYSADAVLLVLASDVYNNDDYIRDYDEYRKLIQG